MLRLRLLLARSILVGPVLLAACGGGGGGGGSSAIVGLLPPDQISVVTPVESAALPPSDPDFGPASDYEQDLARVNVYDPAIEPLQIVNMILCLVGQTGIDQLVNEAPYLAQVNRTICDNGQNQDASDTGQSSGAVDQFQLWTVSSTRASNSAPQSVQYWFAEEDDGQELMLFVDALLTHGVDDQFPFGEFTLNFAGAVDETMIDAAEFGGTLEASRLDTGLSGFGLFFANGNVNVPPAPGEHAERTAATVAVRADQLGGSAHVNRLRREDFGSGDTTTMEDYLIAYDETHFLRALNGGAPLAFHRDQFIENVWRYNLYHASGPQAGQRVELDSGFGFRTESGEFGWIGYWGMWTPPGVSITSGDVITRDEFGMQGQSYTVFRAPGKLIRNTRHTLALDECAGQTFQWWSFDQFNPPTSFIVEYDVNGAVWQKIGTEQPGSSTVDPIDPPEVIDTATLGFLNMWSRSLGGSTSFVHGEGFVTYYAQQFVDGSDPVFANGDLNLFGLTQSLRPDITGAEAEMGNVYLPDPPDVGSAYAFVFDQQDLTLYFDQGSGLERVGLADGEAPMSGPYTWGLRSGPLVTSTAGLTNVWDAWSASEFYVWETGANDWNQFTRVTDALGDFVQFDAPLSFSYVQASGDDRSGDDAMVGQTYFLSYGGPGQLWGLPQQGVDLNADGQPDRWYSLVNLADGLLLGPTGTEYVVKALEIEQRLAPDPAYAGPLDLTGANGLVVPNASLYTAPNIGAAPVVTDPPRVVQGVVVGGG